MKEHTATGIVQAFHLIPLATIAGANIEKKADLVKRPAFFSLKMITQHQVQPEGEQEAEAVLQQALSAR